jgi:phosphonate transport system permease protein
VKVEAPDLIAPGLERPKQPLGPRIFRWALLLGVILPLLWSAAGLNLSVDRILSAPGRFWDIAHRLFPPDLSAETLQRAMPKVMESLFIAWVGTMIAATLSLPLAFLAARNITARPVGFGVRQIFITIRAIPELLLAVLFIPITGVGPWTGTLAIGVNSVGTLGKLSTEVVEGIDPGPPEAVAAVGGTKLAQVRFGVIPQVMPTIIAYWLYRFEINVRASAVIGLVGAGGIGLELREQLAFRNFSRAGTVLLLTIALVLLIDAVSAKLRRRIITGRREPGPIAVFKAAGWTQRILTGAATGVVVAFAVFLLYQLQATP